MAPKLTLITAPTPEPASTAEFMDAMSALASGVVLVTCWVGDRPWGMTVTAFGSASADPPTVMVALLGTVTLPEIGPTSPGSKRPPSCRLS